MGNSKFKVAKGIVQGSDLVWTTDLSGSGNIFRIDSTGTMTQAAENVGTNFGNGVRDFILYNGEIFFSAGSLYKVTANGDIVRVKIRASSADDPKHFTLFDNELYFTATTDGAGHRRLFKIGLDGRIHMVMVYDPGATDAINRMYATDSGLYIDYGNNVLMRLKKI